MKTNDRFPKTLELIDECLPKDQHGNFIKEKEKSDVVHDFLAFLAEQMVELNKEKQKEIKGFLKSLVAQLHILPDRKGNEGIDALTGKYRLKNYLGDCQKGEVHLSFSGFYKLLKENKKRIQANLRNRELYTDLEREYKESLNRLLPVKKRLELTDKLIDKIVYRLYGLTPEEIQVVKGSLWKG